MIKPGETTKYREDRQIVLDADMMDLMARRRKARVPGCDLILHNEGHQIRDYRAIYRLISAVYTALVLLI